MFIGLLLLSVNALQDLMQQHSKALADMGAYYNGITTSNLDLIKSLKDEAVELRSRDVAAAKLLSQVTAENKRLVEPLAQVHATLPNAQILRARFCDCSTARQFYLFGLDACIHV